MAKTKKEFCPQSYSGELAKIDFKTIYDYGCCAFVLLWCLGIEPDTEFEAIKIVQDLINSKAIEKDCTVKWYDAIKNLTGRESTIEFKNIKTLLGIKKRTPVRFDYCGKSHWVGVENGKVKYNPLKTSQCVEKGKPATARIINIKGIDY